jgi:hypothetical protein
MSARTSLGKHEPPKARPRVEEFRPNSFVESNATRDFLHIRAEFFAQVGDFVDEGDLGSQECVSCVLDELGRPTTGVEDRSLVQVKRAINLGHNSFRAFVVGSDDDSIWVLEIVDRGTFPQEFGI